MTGRPRWSARTPSCARPDVGTPAPHSGGSVEFGTIGALCDLARVLRHDIGVSRTWKAQLAFHVLRFARCSWSGRHPAWLVCLTGYEGCDSDAPLTASRVSSAHQAFASAWAVRMQVD